MAEIRKLFWMRHLRAEATSYILHYRRGDLTREGRGLAFWFFPMSTAVAEIPIDDRDLNYLFKGRTRDYQEVVVQGVITYRVTDAKRLADRVDFSIDLERGQHLKQPLDQIAILLTGIAQQAGLQVLAQGEVAELMVSGIGKLAGELARALGDNAALAELGIAVENVRVDELKPTPELERALQTPTRESLQQRADEATFRRRALAVEKERAIAENELQTQVELARREESLIAQQGQNSRQKAEHEAEAQRVAVTARAETERLLGAVEAERTRVTGLAQAEKLQAIGDAKALSEQKRLDAYRNLPQGAVLALAAQELAGQLKIESLTVTPDMLGGLLEKVARLGLAKLEGDAG